jgi:hypothetical protein
MALGSPILQRATAWQPERAIRIRSLIPFLPRLAFVAGWLLFATASSLASTNGAAEIAFDRIIHGWTNYSSAFSATHTAGSSSDYATVASYYTPDCDALPLEYRVIVVWGGPVGERVDFANFDFQVFVWSSLEAFTNSPRLGDVATLTFGAPTGGNTTVPDAITRGGRPAYELRFCLTNANVALRHGHTYLVGFAARNYASGYEDLFVPTASHHGLSDLQAGDILIQGWIEIVNSGGATIYSGELATALLVQILVEPPRLDGRLIEGGVELSWPSAAGCFQLESSPQLSPPAWATVTDPPVAEGDFYKLVLPVTAGAQWFRLRK